MTQAPPGWYPDPENAGQRRYWTGEQWTEQRTGQAPAESTTPTARPWGLIATAAIGVGLLVALIVVAVTAGSAASDRDDARKAVVEEQGRVSELTTQVDTLRRRAAGQDEEINRLQRAIATANTRARAQATAEYKARNDALTARARNQDQRAKDRDGALTARAQALDQRAADLTTQQDDIDAQLGAIEASSITDGTYAVGSDVQAGTYRTTAAAECYWEITSDPNGSDIIENDFIPAGGPAIVSIQAGQYFTSRDCGTWIKSG